MKFTEQKVEHSFSELLSQEGYPHCLGSSLTRKSDDILIEDDLCSYLKKRYANYGITDTEIKSILGRRKLQLSPDNELNKRFPLKSSERSESFVPPSGFTTNFGNPEEWYGTQLPHRDRDGLVQFVTFRLADSLPQSVLKNIEEELKNLSEHERKIEQYKRCEQWLDKGLGSCALGNKVMAQKVQDALMHHHGKKYELLAWSIMPNHVHVLIRTKDSLSKIIQSWKSYTGKWALANNKKYDLGIPTDATAFWMREYWDRFIRDKEHFDNTVKYILANPEKAKLHSDSAAYVFRGHLGSGELQLSDRMKQELHPPK